MLTEAQKATDWLKDRHGEAPTLEAIIAEMDTRLTDIRAMYAEEHKRRMVAESRLAIYENGRP